MTTREQLDQANTDFKQQLKSNLLQTCQQVVFGVGSAEAEIVFIGEAPGQKEDEQGEPFVGAAGKFLNEMLASIGLERSDIYITNIVKCRPPGNRDPLPEEIEEFWPLLVEELKVIKPKLIVTLGRHSLSGLVPNQKISVVHGKLIRTKLTGVGPVNIYALYHPAAALYNGSMRTVLLADFAKIPKVLELV